MVKLISVHTPKCAGLSIRYCIESHFGQENIFYDYIDRPGDPGSPINLDPVGFFQKTSLEVMKLQHSAQAIHGHFHIKKYEKFANSIRTTCLRHPIDRMISHYYYWKKFPLHENILHRYMIENNLSLLQFAQLPFIRYFYTKIFFKGVDMECFDLIGRYENIDTYAAHLGELLGAKFSIPRHNNNVDEEYIQARMKISEELSADKFFLELLSDDIAFYNAVAKE